MQTIVPISKRGTLTLPKEIRERENIKTPGKVKIELDDTGIKIKPVRHFVSLYGSVIHKGKPLDYRKLRSSFAQEVAQKNV